MGDGSDYIKILIDTLEKQVSTLEEILSVTKEQEKIAGGASFDENLFEDTLTKKDALIIRLNELDNGFVSVYEHVRRKVKENPDKYKKDVSVMQELIKKSTDIGNEIKTLENRNRDKLINCFSEKKQEYSARKTAATVAGKYNATMKNSGFISGGFRFDQDQ